MGFRRGHSRAGATVSPHFFHKDSSDCGFGLAHPDVIKGRMLLYTTLRDRLGSRGCTLDVEVPLDGAPQMELVDVLLATPAGLQIAYRILPNAPRSKAWVTEVSALAEENGMVARFLLLESRRKLVDNHPESPDRPLLFVPAADRRLFFSRRWDRYHVRRLPPVAFDNLQYLDTQTEKLLFYRGLTRDFCGPSLFRFDKEHSAAVRDVKIDPADGHFVFPDETNLKAGWEEWEDEERRRIARHEEKLKQEKLRLAELSKQRQKEMESSRKHFLWSESSIPLPASESRDSTPLGGQRGAIPESSILSGNQRVRCMGCGKLTDDWSIKSGVECICQQCARGPAREWPFCSKCYRSRPPHRLQDNVCFECAAKTN